MNKWKYLTTAGTTVSKYFEIITSRMTIETNELVQLQFYSKDSNHDVNFNKDIFVSFKHLSKTKVTEWCSKITRKLYNYLRSFYDDSLNK